MSCTVYIDESGETGVSKIRGADGRGASPYFVMGAVVMRRASQIEAGRLLETLQADFKKTKRWKHATDLSHSQKVHFAKELARMKVRFYGLISNKYTLEEYADQIDWEPHKFYNKCIKYLLEVVASDLNRFGTDYHEPRIVVESRNHDYDALRRFLNKVKENPIYPQSKALEIVNPFSLIAKAKDEEDLLRIADFVSHSIYSCINKTPENFGNPETRYWRELSGRFATDSNGKIIGAGLKCIHSIDQLELEQDVSEMFLRARGTPTIQKR